MAVTPISRLREKLTKAAGVAQRAAEAIEAQADDLIAQEDVIKAQTYDAFAPHLAILDEARDELQAVKDALNMMSNGGPPLELAAPLKPIVAAIPPSLEVVPFISTPVEDTGNVDRVKLNSVGG